VPTLLQINTSVNTGSTGRIAEEIGRRAIAAGYESYIAYGRTARESRSKVIKIGSPWDILWHGMISLLFDAQGYGSKRATRKLIEQLENINPDIILLHNIHGYYLNTELLFSFLKEKNIPVFWTLHDCWPFTGHCTFFDAYGCERWRGQCDHCPNLKGYPKSLFIDRSRNNFDKKKALLTSVPDITFIPVCKWMESVMDGSFMKGYSRRVIYNGTDLNVFKPHESVVLEDTRNKYGLSGEYVILGVASTWDKRKGLRDFEWLREQLPSKYQIVLVGLTSGQVNRLPHGILGITRTESVQELAKLYSLADVFVNPTYVDNFPTTNIEALASGTPVVTYNTGGSPEAINEETGVVVCKGDKYALKEGILNVIQCRTNYSRNVCRMRAMSLFNKDDRFGEYIQLFNQALKA
jgi:glycosyltransferase involved in cell wall biosynthesis